jgi:nicotinamidase-related amidase
MPVTALDDRTALVLVDLQKGLNDVPFAHPFPQVVANAIRLAEHFRRRGRPVVLVHLDFGPDGAIALTPRVDRALSVPPPGADFAEFVAGLRQDGDIVVTKHQWNAFHGTDLDVHLRRRGITGIVLGGVATSIGVESTARAAADHGYNITAAADAMTDPVPAAHEHTVGHVLPLIAEVGDIDDIIRAA